MPGYVVESMFTLEDKASKTLLMLIGNLEKADKALQGIQKMLTLTGKSLVTMGAAAKPVADVFGIMNKEWMDTNKQLTGMAGRMDKVALGFTEAAKTGQNLTTTVGTMTRQIQGLEAAAVGAQGAIRGMGRGAGGIGGGGRGGHGGGFFGGLSGAAGHIINATLTGYILESAAGALLRPSIRYGSELAALRGMGATDAEADQAQAAAVASSRAVPMFSTAENLRVIRERYAIYRNMQDATNNLGGMQQLAFTAQMASDQGFVPHDDPQRIVRTYDKIAENFGMFTPDKVMAVMKAGIASVAASGGMVTPQAQLMAAQFWRSGKLGIPIERAMPLLSFFVAESASARGGSGPLLRNLTDFLSGHMKKGSVEAWTKLGILPPATAFMSAEQAKKVYKNPLLQQQYIGAAMPDYKLAVTDPEAFMSKDVIPRLTATAIKKGLIKAGQTIDDMNPADLKVFLMQTGGFGTETALKQDALMRMVMQHKQIERYFEGSRRAGFAMEAAAEKDPRKQFMMVTAEWNNLLIDFGKTPAVIDLVRGSLGGLANVLTGTDDALKSITVAATKANQQVSGFAGWLMRVAHIPSPWAPVAHPIYGPPTPAQEARRQHEAMITAHAKHASTTGNLAIAGLIGAGAVTAGIARYLLSPVAMKVAGEVAGGVMMRTNVGMRLAEGAAGLGATALAIPGMKFLSKAILGGGGTGLGALGAAQFVGSGFLQDMTKTPEARARAQRLFDPFSHTAQAHFAMPDINITIPGTNLINIPALTKMMQDIIAKWLAMFMKGFAGSHAGQTPMTDVVSHG